MMFRYLGFGEPSDTHLCWS
ncbi:hypothetical protein Goshw_016261 [Gossypium schwendimanii]|uniref:Uncharacterized protein n=1 Tax=Gossypium schwendimanii TaxID=34291 RepID=A0A7J9NEQ5_GOSSC|nr:hypothetical protein [Gossypium schwendimanii]